MNCYVAKPKAMGVRQWREGNDLNLTVSILRLNYIQTIFYAALLNSRSKARLDSRRFSHQSTRVGVVIL